VVTHLFKYAEQLIREKSPKETREEVFLTTAKILSTYREKCSEGAPIGQLILPECLKLLPVYANCIVKNDALFGGNELMVDDRAWMMQLVQSMRVEVATAFLYPRIFCITRLPFDSSGQCSQFPSQIRASIEYFDPEDAYFIENNLVAFIWIGQRVSNEWLHDVFNAKSLERLDTEKHYLPELDNPTSNAIRNILYATNENRPRQVKLFIIKQTDGLESWMKKFLVEDRYAANSISYVDFLCKVHQEIRSLTS